jgi:hypothetical protein
MQVITEGGDRLTEGAAVQLPGDRGGGQGGGSPDMQGARQAAMQSCAADMKKLCPGQAGREAIRCLHDNSAKAGATCKAALSRMPRGRPQGGGQR